ncbi:hypothetical protein BpHYR1_023308 [Brachionus plicatilis]|uniref:Uncharacterized protein n=1 Tax=Brachionus plicatilis TaxID=10195 RepID=A0A3M7RP26_BRAPC|nr:hypothetical protein BpHYR1_023308 [Brachionus plicatilis]
MKTTGHFEKIHQLFKEFNSIQGLLTCDHSPPNTLTKKNIQITCLLVEQDNPNRDKFGTQIDNLQNNILNENEVT